MEHHFLFVRPDSSVWLLYVAVLLITVFFRFSRLLTVRNLDLVLILLLSTALVLAASTGPEESPSSRDSVTTQNVVETSETQLSATSTNPDLVVDWASIAVLALSILLIVRLVFDEALTRRPRLEQNLNQAGLTFLFLPAFAILMTGIFLTRPPRENVNTVEAGLALLEAQESSPIAEDNEVPSPTGTILAAGAVKVAELSGTPTPFEIIIARILAFIAHTAVILGLVFVGRRHFCSPQLGMAMSCLYLLLPCTAYNVHEFSHVVPGACLTWAVAMYRKPAVAGVLLGLACGTLFFAVFLLPVWAVFYGRNARLRFAVSLAAVATVVLIIFALTSENTDSFFNKLVMTANWTVYRLFDAASPMPDKPTGHVILRITLAALFFVMLVAMTVIPRKRNLENLLANSTALIVAAQLWYPEDVGSYVLWYLPLLLLVVFRPRLDRFVPPEDTNTHSASRFSDDSKPTPAGVLSRVTLYN